MGRRVALSMAFGLAALALAAMASTAGATHPRPAGATPVRLPLVPAYNQCTAPDRTHGPPLAFGSCNPPVHASSFLTIGTPDANGAPANSVGIIKLEVVGNPESSEVMVEARVGDVRCKPAAGACGNPNAADGPDYIGDLQANATIRITDHWNATSPGGGPDAATVLDIPFPITMQCSNTADPAIGGTCAATTTAVQPGVPSPTTKRGVVEITQFLVIDGGADGVVSTTPNSLFASTGLFVP